MKTRSQIKSLAFTTVELLISIGLSSGLAVGFLYGFKKLSTSYKVESLKNQLIDQHHEIREFVLDDLRHAFKITGSTGTYYYPVSRLPSTQGGVAANSFDPTSTQESLMSLTGLQLASGYSDFDPADMYDGFQILKDIYPEISGAAKVVLPSSENVAPNDKFLFSVYYALEDSANPTDRDQYFQAAFKHKKYFFLSNGDFRNIIENFDYRSDATQTAVNCPACTDINNCEKCYVFHGGYRDSAGKRIMPPTKILKSSESSRMSTNIRVGEKVTYQVGGPCGEDHLCRWTDDNEATAESLLTHVKEMRVLYKFPQTDEVSNTAKLAKDAIGPISKIRSLRDASYWNETLPDGTDATKLKKAVSFQDVSFMEITFKEDLPADLNALLSNSKESVFSFEEGSYRFKSMIRAAPGFESLPKDAPQSPEGMDPACYTMQTARCNPSGKCNWMFTGPSKEENNGKRSIDSKDYQYDSDHPSEFCRCGWSADENRFYEPESNLAKLPYYSTEYRNLVVNHWGYSNTDATPNKNRSNACAGYFKCGLGYNADSGAHISTAYDQYNPICKLMGCLWPEGKNHVYVPETGYDDDAEARLNDIITSENDDYLRCHAGRDIEGINGCDKWYRIWKNLSVTDPAGPKHVENLCACRTKDISPGILPSRYLYFWELSSWESLCNVPGAAKQCENTWDSATKSYIIADAAHPQGLGWDMAKLCACRRNLPESASPSISSDFTAVSGTNPNILPAAQHGSNQIYVPDGTQHGGDVWNYNDWQWPNPLYCEHDIRVDADSSLYVDEFGVPQGVPLKDWPQDGNILNFPAAGSLSPPDKPDEFYYACGWTGTGAGSTKNPHPKCLSYKSQVARGNFLSNGTVQTSEYSCAPIQVATCGYSPGACLAEGHSEVAPDGFPTNVIAEGHPLWNYRFFCDSDCGMATNVNQGMYVSNAPFFQEIRYIRWLIRRAAQGGSSADAAWCKDIQVGAVGGGSSSSSSGGTQIGNPSLGGD